MPFFVNRIHEQGNRTQSSQPIARYFKNTERMLMQSTDAERFNEGVASGYDIQIMMGNATSVHCIGEFLAQTIEIVAPFLKSDRGQDNVWALNRGISSDNLGGDLAGINDSEDLVGIDSDAASDAEDTKDKASNSGAKRRKVLDAS